MGGIDRFAYRAINFTRFDEKFYTYISWFLPIPFIGGDSKNEKLGFLFFALYFVYLLWVGDKFGSLFIALYFLVLVFVVTKEYSTKVYNKIFLIL